MQQGERVRVKVRVTITVRVRVRVRVTARVRGVGASYIYGDMANTRNACSRARPAKAIALPESPQVLRSKMQPLVVNLTPF